MTSQVTSTGEAFFASVASKSFRQVACGGSTAVRWSLQILRRWHDWHLVSVAIILTWMEAVLNQWDLVLLDPGRRRVSDTTWYTVETIVVSWM